MLKRCQQQPQKEVSGHFAIERPERKESHGDNVGDSAAANRHMSSLWWANAQSTQHGVQYVGSW